MTGSDAQLRGRRSRTRPSAARRFQLLAKMSDQGLVGPITIINLPPFVTSDPLTVKGSNSLFGVSLAVQTNLGSADA
jgi:hypothetical protein